MDTLLILQKLIEFDTSQVEGKRACVTFIKGILQQNSFDVIDILTDDVSHLWATNTKEPKIILSGHYDVVPATSDLFIPKICDNSIFGRGTTDMKSFIAVVLGLLPEIKKNNLPVAICLTGDEETNLHGIMAIMENIKKLAIKPELVLIGEPTNFKVGIANKGCVEFDTTIIGKEAHAGTPKQGINAGLITCKLVNLLFDLQEEYKSLGTLINVGMFNSGRAINMISGLGQILWSIRAASNVDVHVILKTINDYICTLKIEFEGCEIINKKITDIPAFQKEERTSNQYANGVELSYSTEAGYFQNIGLTPLLFGCGDERLAHTAHEHILIDDLIRYQEKLWQFLITQKL